jgi:DNA-directed RNA polymerase subunit K
MSAQKEQFTKYEIARIIGARGLQIAMDAPLLIKIPEDKLEEMKHDALQIAEYELQENALPISIHRPIPRKGKHKLETVKEEKISDEELTERAKEVEKEITESPSDYSLVEEEEAIEEAPETAEEK